MRLFSYIWEIFGSLYPRDSQPDGTGLPEIHRPKKAGDKPETSALRSTSALLEEQSESQRAIRQFFSRVSVTDQLPWDDGNTISREGDYDFAAPYRGSDDTAEADLIDALLKTKAFQRLKGVRFLGALDYFLVSQPNGSLKRYTRYQHSLGVATLAKAYLRLRHHSTQHRLLCVAAAMLHDVGHPPFSHTLEPVFEETFGLNHHVATERLITGLVPLGNEISSVLRDFGVDPLAVLHLLNGGDELFEGFFSGPINLDTIEGILRARVYLGMQKLGLSPVKVMEAAASRDNAESQRIVDAFWQSKHEVYAFVIRSKPGVFYDGIFQAIAREQIDALQPSDFFATEKTIFQKLPLLKDVLDSDRLHEIAKRVLPTEIPYQFRSFFIDDKTDFRSHHDNERYLQQRIGSSLTVRDFLRV